MQTNSLVEKFSAVKAIQQQKEMAARVVCQDQFGPLKMIGGMDVSNNLYDPKQMIYASTIVMDFPSLSLKEESFQAEQQTIPYITGLLGFREAPTLVKSFQSLLHRPDLIFVDGHGISHPRGLGIASHIGVLLDIPTIGVAKSILVGEPKETLGNTPGSQTPLIWKNETIGVLLRTKKNCNPLIISVGHRVSLDTAVQLVKQCLKNYRLPLPTRQAHLSANNCRRSYSSYIL